MRILMLNNEFPPLGGGTGTVNEALLQRFADLPDLEIDLITSALGKHRHEGTLSDHIRVYKVPVNNRNIHHSSNKELLTYATKALRLALKLYNEHPYHLCFAWSAVPAGGVALALHKLLGLPYLVRVCGPDIPGFEQRYHLIYPMLTPLIRAIWRGADAVIAKCEGEAEMIRAVDEGVGVTIIPNGVDLDRFRPGVTIPDDGPLRLLCVGRLIERKGQHHLIHAVKRLTDAGVNVVLDLVGTGDALEDNRALAKRLGIEDKVIFAGYVPREEIAARYAAADVFVLPSYNEGMSVATLEAMASGLPVVVTRTGGTAEMVREGRNGFTFDWADVDLLVHNLCRLHRDRKNTRAMGELSRLLAESFCWLTAVNAYSELFYSVAANSKLPIFDV
jgi:phosphatidyl-myo-inositol dimannoside synthase